MGVAVAVLVAACGSSSKPTTTTTTISAASEIPLAPAFSNEELFATPAANWITPPGGTSGERYSSLSQINTSNVAELKGDWLTELNGSGDGDEVLAGGLAGRVQGRDLHPHGRLGRVRRVSCHG